MDNMYNSLNGHMDLLPPKNMKKGSTTKMLEEYLRNIEIKYITEDYPREDVYKSIDYLSDKLIVRFPNLVSKPKIKWNKDKDIMNFNFKTRGFDVSGNIKIDEKNLIVSSHIPGEAVLYRKQIENKIKRSLEKVFPKPLSIRVD